MAKRRNFSAGFKAKVALEALWGDQTLAELAARHGVHPNLITKWKRQAAEGMVEVFAGKSARRDGVPPTNSVHRKNPRVRDYYQPMRPMRTRTATPVGTLSR